ncbi:hypothetical protein ES703_108356 [subsurface metagenome]
MQTHAVHEVVEQHRQPGEIAHILKQPQDKIKGKNVGQYGAKRDKKAGGQDPHGLKEVYLPVEQVADKHIVPETA